MAKQTFENAMKRLETIVEDLESGELTLDQALKKFEEGVKLSKFCSSKLDEAERKVSILQKNEQGGIEAEPFYPEKEENDTP